MKTYIIGHKNPDTDSVVSAIALAELEKVLGKDYIPAIADDVNKEAAFILDKFGFEIPKIISREEKKVILVDHNEASQISEDIKNEEIIEIIDHHKLGGLSTPEPIPVRIKPVGSTSTIVASLFKENNEEIDENIAKILISGIISDTLNFNSPTTTEEDKETAETLNKIANINIDELANEMFKAKSDLSGISSEELVEMDYKEFNINNKKVGVAVFETVDIEPSLERKDEFVEILKNKKEKDKLDYLIFSVIDILAKKAYFIAPNEIDEGLINKAFKLEKDNDKIFAKDIVSRKKQIIPAIEKVL